MSRGEKPVAGSGFRWGGADQKRFRGLLHAANVSAARLDARSRITHRQRRLLFTFQYILVSIVSLPCGAMPRTKLFPEALQHDREHQVFTMDRRDSRWAPSGTLCGRQTWALAWPHWQHF